MTPHAHTALRARLRREEGMAMMVAMIVLLIVTVLAAGAVAVAVQTNGSTKRDANKKNALEAAEAGLQIGNYRLNMLRPQDTYCVGDGAAAPGSTGTCQSSTYTLGNGATYQYYTTPVLGSSGTCVGLTVVSSTNISQRCITAVGSANGITARSQIRVAAFGAQPLFAYGGVTGINGVTNGNNATINGSEASNGNIGGGNSKTSVLGAVLGPKGTYTGSGAPPVTRLPGPIVPAPVDPGTSNQSLLADCPTRQAAGYTTCNDDNRITNGIIDPTGNTKPFDQSNGVSFNAATRTLTTANNHPSITLGGGLYNFCEVDINNNATIGLAPGVQAEIFIDSPDDPNSGCPAGSGSLNAKNNVTWLNPANDPTALQIYVYGWNNGLNVLNFMNNGNCECVLYAPQSTVNLSHNSSNSDLTGAVLGNKANAPNNFNFTWDSRVSSLQARSTGLYYRTAWAQCTPTPTTVNAPGSGCG